MQTTSGRIKFAQEEIDTPNPEQAEEQTSSSGRIKFNPVAQEEFKSNFNIRENTGAVNIDELVSKYTNPEQPTEKKGGFLSSTAKSIANFGIGVGKGAISTLEGASSLGERMLRGATKALLPKAAEEVMGISGDLEQTEAEKLIPEEYRTPEGTAQKAGFMTEQIAEFFIPGAASAKVGKAAKASKYLETAPKWAKELVPLLSRSLTEAGVVGTQVSIQQGKADKEALGAAGVAAAFPIAGAALSKAAQPLKELRPKVASRLINSIIKPRAGEFAYGKNPGLQIAKEGIVANSMDDLISKVSKKKAEVGRMIGDAIKPVANEIVSAKNVLNPIDDALAKLSRAPQTNSAAINRLQAVKDDILSMVANNLDDVSIEELSQLKMDIGDLAKWTGSASDDKLVNTAIQNSYRAARDIIEEKAPAITKLNERWGNLLSAEKAAKHRADILNRQDLIGLGEKVLGTGVGATTGFLLGGDAQGAVLGGVGAAGLSKLMATPAFRTRIASMLAKATDAEKKQLLRSLPGIKDVIKRIFGDDEAIKLLPKLPKAAGKEIAETVVEKTPKTVKAVTKKLPKSKAVASAKQKASLDTETMLDVMYQQAPESKKYIDDLSSKIASKFKGTVAIAPLKGRKRALEKVLEDYGGDASKLTDLARNTIVIKGGSEQSVIDNILKKANVETWRFVKAEEDILGYSGGMVKVKTPNGQISEIQVNNPEMIFAKEPEEIAKVILGNSQYLKLQKRFGKGGEGHKYYEEFRELIKNKESNFNRLEEIQKESKEYYSRFKS